MRITRRKLMKPDAEFSPFPFWFLNGNLTEKEIDRQLKDFADKGINGVVLHPRIGLSSEIGYMTPRYLELIRHAVKTCRALGISVLLYDEGMYPSGSAHCEVVKRDPAYAAKGIWANEQAGGKLLKRFALTRNEAGQIVAAVETDLSAEDEEIFDLYTGFTGGTIRGVHEGEDDGEKNAPKAADLLNAEAMRAFISFTHEKYFGALSGEFGKTVIGFFTDEPSPVGRCVRRGVLPWSEGFEKDLYARGFCSDMFPLLFDEASANTPRAREARRIFSRALCDRLRRTYYSPISAWCEAHGIKLCGHPHSPMDSGLLSEFGIPGQDIVWRWVAPEGGKALEGDESAQAKCASDAARHSGKRRNLNECFGCCGPEGRMWAFTVDDMKWYIDWLAVRGCNMYVPHAFYYETDTPLKLDRPPDNGPNNIWWPYYAQIANYMKRLSYLNTDCVNGARVAVLGSCDRLPVDAVRPLYENCIEFNYLTEEDLLSGARFEQGKLKVVRNAYDALLLDMKLQYGGDALKLCDRLRGEGLKVYTSFAQTLNRYRTVRFDRRVKDVRVSLDRHENAETLMLVNEGDGAIRTGATLPFAGRLVVFDPWSGELSAMDAPEGRAFISLERRQCLVLIKGLDTRGLKEYESGRHGGRSVRLDARWELTLSDGRRISYMGNWADHEELSIFSGSLVYSCGVSLREAPVRAELELGTVYEMAEVYVNGTFAGALLRPPYSLDVTRLLRKGKNRIEVRVVNSLEPYYSHKPWRGGMCGPSRLLIGK